TRAAPRRADARPRGLQRSREWMLALAQRAGCAHHVPALRREKPRDLGADAAARSRHQHALAVELAHGLSFVVELRAMVADRLTASRLLLIIGSLHRRQTGTLSRHRRLPIAPGSALRYVTGEGSRRPPPA